MQIFDNRYEQQELLGRGAFSEVWKVRDTETGVTLALKVYQAVCGLDDGGSGMMTHEFALMVNANHKNLLRPLFYASCENRPYLILPYCEKGNIGNEIGKMTEDEAWKLLRDCASALAYLHALRPPILHQDIKPANILKGDNGEYMITDFGVSTQMKATLSRVSHEEMELFSSGTIAYMAPERFSRNNLPNMANDVYSLGATVYEMLTGDLPFGNDGGLLQKKGADVPELVGDYSPMLKETIEKCLQKDPWNRPEARQLEEIANNAIYNQEVRWKSPVAVEEHVSPAVGNNNRQQSLDETAGRKFYWPYLVIGVAGVVIAVIIWFFLSSKDWQEQLGVDEVASQQEENYDEEYVKYVSQLYDSSAKSVREAFLQLSKLAEKGYPKAVHQVAFTYAWTNDLESVRRKKLLGWKVDKSGLPDSVEVNKQAVRWLNLSVQSSDSSDYQALYWLSFYFINKIQSVTEPDHRRAFQLLRKASAEASVAHDYQFKEKVDDTIRQMENMLSK